MAAYLLDTHTILWYSENNENLSPKAAKIISNPDNELFVSIASFWEISLKINIGKLQSSINIDELYNYLVHNNINVLPIKLEHLNVVKSLPLFHRDPFDRLIISQASFENLIVLSRDNNFELYEDITIIW